MKATSFFFLVMFPLLVLSACGGDGSRSVGMDEAAPALPGTAPERMRVAKNLTSAPSSVEASYGGGETAGEVRVESPKIIREGQITFETFDLGKTRSLIDTLLQRHESYLSSDEQYKFDDRIEQRLVLRVPADNFGALLADLEQNVERFDSKRVSARDVTEEYIDVSQRLRVKRETEKRYLEVLSKAKNVSDILEAERYIGQVRSEIESLEGRLQYLENRIGFSTLTISFYQLKPEVLGFSSQFGVAWSNGWNNFMLFLLGAVSLWPFLMAGFLLIGLIYLLGSLRR
ncbi:hypothetical protein CHL67_10265 [Prosthecochloris sp. GSB1]|uniref:DUF4349 domain-containing protein n=1 Tax=Prosthecochloris sp. GSB1 TaxID=281093 RepID=UPI000B8CAFBF|nr:DUF4349 domain-containing protein [Prosthecochloris sp. GSB1]ASQ91244.1 hypothetical protein CHL67_10265 [Prosthecochloris sp. GSB1]